MSKDGGPMEGGTFSSDLVLRRLSFVSCWCCCCEWWLYCCSVAWSLLSLVSVPSSRDNEGSNEAPALEGIRQPEVWVSDENGCVEEGSCLGWWWPWSCAVAEWAWWEWPSWWWSWDCCDWTLCGSLGGVGGSCWFPEDEEPFVPLPEPRIFVEDDAYDEGGEADDANLVDGGGVGHVDAWCGAGGCNEVGWAWWPL